VTGVVAAPADRGPGSGARRLLEVEDVYADYGATYGASHGREPILQGVSLRVDAGEIVSIIGPNGAGKSTVLKVVVGLLRPQAGRVRLAGEALDGRRPDEIIRRGLAYVPQGRIVFPQMTVVENLEMGGYTVREPAKLRAAVERVHALFPILLERRRQKAGTLSGGEQQMLAIGRALMTAPRLVVLDEPSLGLSPKFLAIIFEKLAELRASGTTLLMVEQNAVRALGMSDRAYVLELGRNRFEGPGPALLADPEVRRLYLGG
jgi:ABC-type branched-subunit amino acid transport system ATPase component